MADQQNNQASNQSDEKSQQGNSQVQNINQVPVNSNQAQGNNQDQQSSSPDDVQHQFGNEGVQEGYSYLGPQGISVDEPDAPDNYGPQDQFGDVDGQDPYSNLANDDPGSTPAGDGLDDLDQTLYGLAEPLAKPGDQSVQGTNKDRYGTRGSQDQHGYQK